MAEQESSHVHAGVNSDSSPDDVDNVSCVSRLLSSDDAHTAAAQDESDTLSLASVSTDHLDTSDVLEIPGPPEGSKPCDLEKLNTAQTVDRISPTRHSRLWKTIALATGFLLLAFFSALGHYLLAHNLEGKPVDTAYLKQPQVSAVSILLTTIFKAAVTASMGICFAQHLWYLLRQHAMSLSEVERLFVIRSDIIAFSNPRGIWKTPLLFLIALLVWCLKVAMIYPPGALSVTLEPHTSIEPRNMSVMNPVVSDHVEVSFRNEYTYSGLAEATLATDSENSTYSIYQYVRPALYTWYSSTDSSSGPAKRLKFTAQTIMTNGQISTLPSQPGENSTYQLHFTAPQFRCNTQRYHATVPAKFERRNTTVPTIEENRDWITMESYVFEARWNISSLVYTVSSNDFNDSPPRFTTYRDDNGTVIWGITAETTKKTCEPTLALFTVNISFPGGDQRVEYTTNNTQNLTEIPDSMLSPWARRSFRRDTTLPEILTLTNYRALLDALGTRIDDGILQTFYLDASNCTTSLDGSTLQQCAKSSQITIEPSHSILLQGTVFDKSRFEPSRIQDFKHPQNDLNLTEALLNQVLANIAISAISLGLWWDEIPVTFSRYRSLYRFSDPLNLIVPYSLCFTAAVIFAAIATWSLLQNGIPAADGGFLQIMLATRGNTEMNRRVWEEDATTVEDMSDELKNLKVRYGELLVEGEVEGIRRGFGTVDETASLRKRR